MDIILNILTALLLLHEVSAFSTDSESFLVTANDVKFHGSERFPGVIEVSFGNTSLVLDRDDEDTNILSEDFFKTSRILPSGVFKAENRHCFAVYNTRQSDALVVHRETDDGKPKFYGRFTQNNVKMLIESVEGSEGFHRIRREEKLEHTRKRRDINDRILELFVFADLSVYEFLRDEYDSAFGASDVGEYMQLITKEVDLIYQYLGTYGIDTPFRVYFQQYQTILASNQQPWVTNNLAGGKLQATSVNSFQSYYLKLMTKYAFPYPDHVVALTRLDIEGDVQVLSTGSICGTSWSLGASIARLQTYPVSIAKGIAYSFGLQDDSLTSCDNSAQYVMSDIYEPYTDAANQGNRWMFSNCSVSAFETAFGGGADVSCLQTEDSVFDLEYFDSFPYLGQSLPLDLLCKLRYGTGSFFCASESTPDCYSIANGCGPSCDPIYIPQYTTCYLGDDAQCIFGSCEVNRTTTTSSTTSTVTTTTSTITEATSSTTTDSDLQTTTTTAVTQTFPTTTTPPEDCVVETGFVEFDLPGCGCCGGCGCDQECSDCVPGLPSETKTEECIKEPNCCGSKVRVRTLFVPTGCELTYKNGPRTIVMEKKGWEERNAEVTAEVYQDSNDRWHVSLVPKS